jgi:tetratricopeptide (TPR) repeat protein
VTGIEDVERTIFDRYDTVLHELTHQVHGVLTADQSRAIQELYRQAKERDDRTRDGFLSRYAGGSVWEYFAEGANALKSPRRDAYDPREIVGERLTALDPDLERLVREYFAISDVSASYPVAYVNAGYDRLERGEVEPAVAFCEKALARDPDEETALQALVYGLSLRKDERTAEAAGTALRAHPASGQVATTASEALWHTGTSLEACIAQLQRARNAVRPEDRYLVDLALGRYFWIQGDAAMSRAAYDSALAYQSDNPEALWGKASALALAADWDSSFALYDQAVRLRTGVVGLRTDYARDLLHAGRREEAEAQLREAGLLDAEDPMAEALRGWSAMVAGDWNGARAHLDRALELGPWNDTARILMTWTRGPDGSPMERNEEMRRSLREEMKRKTSPDYVYRPKLAQWRSVHEFPAVERRLLEEGPYVHPPGAGGSGRTGRNEGR